MKDDDLAHMPALYLPPSHSLVGWRDEWIDGWMDRSIDILLVICISLKI